MKKRPHRNEEKGRALDRIPDVRDGLTRLERAILVVLAQTQRELGHEVPTAMLYGRVLELVDVGQQEFQETLARLVGRKVP
ncbi:MAG: hypothetical protein QM765_50420 [Myxococcales bacterium]